jgi:hypothetical protein
MSGGHALYIMCIAQREGMRGLGVMGSLTRSQCLSEVTTTMFIAMPPLFSSSSLLQALANSHTAFDQVLEANKMMTKMLD